MCGQANETYLMSMSSRPALLNRLAISVRVVSRDAATIHRRGTDTDYPPLLTMLEIAWSIIHYIVSRPRSTPVDLNCDPQRATTRNVKINLFLFTLVSYPGPHPLTFFTMCTGESNSTSNRAFGTKCPSLDVFVGLLSQPPTSSHDAQARPSCPLLPPPALHIIIGREAILFWGTRG